MAAFYRAPAGIGRDGGERRDSTGRMCMDLSESGRRDSNSRPLDPQSSALTKLRYAPPELAHYCGRVGGGQILAALKSSPARGNNDRNRFPPFGFRVILIPMPERPLRVMVLYGGPDRERPVSLHSGREVADALAAAGHDVRLRDVLPDQLECLDEFRKWGGDVIFPVLHGGWGEGGPLQEILEERGLRFVGCRAAAADLCMDKYRTKRLLERHSLPTPRFELLSERGAMPSIPPPVVLKALREGSSLGMAICHVPGELEHALDALRREHPNLLVEQFIHGKELTVGVIDDPDGPRALPPICIMPAAAFYDYQAKYERNDTRYVFDAAEMGLTDALLSQLRLLAADAHQTLGCRHLSRVDFMVSADGHPYVLEVNTMPGFTTHSLLPKAAARAGMEMPQLVNHLVRLAAGTPAD